MKIINKSYPELLTGVKQILKQVGLRPTINICKTTTDFIDKSGCFFMVNLYWNESYMDKLYFTPKWDIIIQELTKYLTGLPNISKVQTGGSDGHLFFILSITK